MLYINLYSYIDIEMIQSYLMLSGNYFFKNSGTPDTGTVGAQTFIPVRIKQQISKIK